MRLEIIYSRRAHSKLWVTVAILLASLVGYNSPASAANLPPIPIFVAEITPQVSGYSVLILNHDPTFTWQVTASSGTTYIDSSGRVTVIGALGGYLSTLVIRASKSGYDDSITSVQVTPLAIPWSNFPSLQKLSQAVSSFTIGLNNYDQTMNWKYSSSVGTASLSSDNKSIVVSNLKRGEESILKVSVSKPGYEENTSSITWSSISPPLDLTPAVGPIQINGTGFTTQVTNFDDYFEWTVSASEGSASISPKGIITVVGFDLNKITFVNIAASYKGALAGQLRFLGYAKVSALSRSPQFGSVATQLHGFKVQIVNFDSSFNWRVSSNMGDASLDPSGAVTVTNLDLGTSAKVEVSSQIGDAPATTSNISGSSYPLIGYTPEFSEPISNSDGFEVKVTNFNSFYEYTVQSNDGKAVIDALGNVLVSGLSPGASTTVTVQTLKSQELMDSSETTGTATLSVVLAPVPKSAPIPLSKKPVVPRTGTPKTIVKKKPAIVSTGPGTITVICVKGSVRKFVTALKPSCPSGFKKIKL